VVVAVAVVAVAKVAVDGWQWRRGFRMSLE
jgi:hypothetical protein